MKWFTPSNDLIDLVRTRLAEIREEIVAPDGSVDAPELERIDALIGDPDKLAEYVRERVCGWVSVVASCLESTGGGRVVLVTSSQMPPDHAELLSSILPVQPRSIVQLVAIVSHDLVQSMLGTTGEVRGDDHSLLLDSDTLVLTVNEPAPIIAGQYKAARTRPIELRRT